MPLVRIEILKGRPPGERQQLLDAVHDALVEAFTIPEDDRTQRIVEHDPANFEIPPGASQRYTLIEITTFPADRQPPNEASTRRSFGIWRPQAFLPRTSSSFSTSHPWRTGASAVGNRRTKWISATRWTSDSVAGYGSGGRRACGAQKPRIGP